MNAISLPLLLLSSTIFGGYGKVHSSVRQATTVKPSALEKQVIAKEREGLDCLKIGDLKRLADLLADDVIVVEPDGRANKAEVMKGAANLKITSYTIEDTKFTLLSETSALLVYTLEESGSYSGTDFTKRAYASVIWAKRGDHWQCLFSQETEIK